MIPESFKQDLLNRIDIVELVERYVPLRKGGANYVACCPFHSEKSPSFTVSPTKQFYHCFGCGAHGNAIGFLMEYQGLGYVEAVSELASSLGMKLPAFERSGAKPVAPDLLDIMDRAARYYREQLRASPQAIDYLKGRGLTGTVAARFGIGYAPAGWQGLKSVFGDYEGGSLKEAGLVIDGEGGRRYDRFRERIMFPILNQRGATIAFGGRILGPGEPKYLNSPETPLFEKGRELYGLPQARDAIRARARVLVVEGYMDVVALAQFGVEYSVATLGTATSTVHVQKLFRLTDELVFCFDGDAAGRRAAWHALEVCLPVLADTKTVRFMFLPEEDDPDSFIRVNGSKAFEARVAQAMPLSQFFLAELKGRQDMATAEGRSRLVAEAKPLLKKVAAPALQLQILSQLAEAANMSKEDVGRLTDIRVSGRGRPAAPVVPGQARGRVPSAERRLLELAMVNPAISDRIPLDFLDTGTEDGLALRAFVEFARSQSEKDKLAPNLIEHFKGDRLQILFEQVQGAILEVKLLAEDAEAEFVDMLPQLERRHVHREIDRLKARLEEGDAAQLNRLTARLAELSKRGAAPPNMI